MQVQQELPFLRGSLSLTLKVLQSPNHFPHAWQCLFSHHFLSREIKQLSILGKAPALKFSKSCMEL